MGEWATVRLRDVCDRVDYGVPAGASSADSGVRLLRITDIVAASFSWDRVPFVSPADAAAQRTARYRLRAGDIVVARTGATTGASRWLASVPEGAVFGSYLVRFRVSEHHDSRFVGYALNNEPYWNHVHAVLGEKSAQPNASAATLAAAPIRVPRGVAEQRAIAAVLGALDDKIAVNDRVVDTAAELATTVFQSAVRECPEGFTATPLSRTAEFVNGRAFTRNATGTGRMVIRIAELTSGPGNATVYNDIEVASRHLANPGDILFSWSGSLAVRRWYRPPGIVNQHIFKVVPKDGFPAWLVLELVNHQIDRFRAAAADRATTLGHIRRQNLDEPVPVPDIERLAWLDASLEPLWRRALSAEQERLALAKLRDTLLPHLMSGTLQLTDAERLVARAT